MSYLRTAEQPSYSSYQQSSLLLNVDTNNTINSNSNIQPKSFYTRYCTTFRLSVTLIIILLTIIFFLFTHISHNPSTATSSSVANIHPLPSIFATFDKKKKDKKNSKKDDESDDDSDKSFCEDDDYFKKIVKEQLSVAFGGIIIDLHGTKKYEASGITYDINRNVFWVVFDSLFALGKIYPDFIRSPHNKLVKSATEGYIGTEDSGFEGIAVDDETGYLYLLTESVEFETRHAKRRMAENDESISYYAVIREVEVEGVPLLEPNADESYDILNTCMVDFPFTSDNKGFESLVIVSMNGMKYFIGLCEGNHCSSGDEGKDAGNGRVVVIDFEMKTDMRELLKEYPFLYNTDINCVYKYLFVVHLPESAYFVDYSALDIRAVDDDEEVTHKFAVASQENSEVWIGSAVMNGESCRFLDAEVLAFPKNDNCETVFCNVEGLVWVNDNTFVAVSDKAKKDGDQPFACKMKDQSLHIFQAQ